MREGIGDLKRGHSGLLRAVAGDEQPTLHIDAAFGVARDSALVLEGDGAAVGEAASPDGFEYQRKRRFCFWRDDDAFQRAAARPAVFGVKPLLCGFLAGDASTWDDGWLFVLGDRDCGRSEGDED